MFVIIWNIFFHSTIHFIYKLIQKTGQLLNIGGKFNCVYTVVISFCTVVRLFFSLVTVNLDEIYTCEYYWYAK